MCQRDKGGGGGGGKVEERKRNEEPRETAEGCGKGDEAAPETFQVPSFPYSSLACKQEICAVTQSARGCWQPAQSWPEPSLRCSQLRRDTGGCLVHLCWALQSIRTTCARGDTALQQTKPARLQSWLESWVQ